ncbi:hypothetical protein HOG48_02490 [Candidatus Peregrinibacteria bacterium]|nr:hypothetical protein [Candidatus Peregrinibacteria bacterium]
MNPFAAQKTGIDQELLHLMSISPSLNAFPREQKEAISIRITTLPEDKQLEVKDMLMKEQENLATASTQELHDHYMKLKEAYSKLKEVKSSLQGKLRKVKEMKDRHVEESTLKNLEGELNDNTN